MGRDDSLTIFVDTLKHDALQMERWLAEKNWARLHEHARMALSTASRIHMRVTAIRDALTELGEE